MSIHNIFIYILENCAEEGGSADSFTQILLPEMLPRSQSWMLFVIIIFRIHTAWKFLYRQQVRVLDTGSQSVTQIKTLHRKQSELDYDSVLRTRARGQFQNFSNSLSSYTPDLKFAKIATQHELHQKRVDTESHFIPGKIRHALWSANQNSINFQSKCLLLLR